MGKDADRFVTPSALPDYGVEMTDKWLRELESRGAFPCRVYLSPRKFVYSETELQAWIEKKKRERESDTPAAA
ncbi:MAG TPA: hypothetical protein VM325_17220 [Alphaproteobacteria bacterium]|nr:hypothetical protein [Alphaproteobacteria bacterium]